MAGIGVITAIVAGNAAGSIFGVIVSLYRYLKRAEASPDWGSTELAPTK